MNLKNIILAVTIYFASITIAWSAENEYPNGISKISDTVFYLDFDSELPVSKTNITTTGWIPQNFNGDSKRLKLVSDKGENKVIFDTVRLIKEEQVKGFQLSIYSHGFAAKKVKSTVIIKTSSDGVDYQVAETVISNPKKSLHGGRKLYLLRSTAGQKPFRYLMVRFKDLKPSWKLELGDLLMTTTPLNDFQKKVEVKEVKKLTQKSPQKPLTKLEAYPIPVKLRNKINIKDMYAAPFTEKDVDLKSIDPKTIPWQNLTLLDTVRKASSWTRHGFHRDTKCMLYKFFVKTPSEMPEQVILNLEQSSFITTIYVDGTQVDQHMEGFLPLETDITKAVSGTGQHEIIIKVQDHNSCRDSSNSPLIPLGAMYKWTKGIIMPPVIEARNSITLENPFIRADVAKGELFADITIRNSAKADTSKITIDICDMKGNPILSAEKKFSLTTQSQPVSFAFSARNKLQLWDIGKPNLYLAKFKIYNNNKLVDYSTTTFGYRTVSVEGENIILNGRKIRLLGPWAHIGEWTWAKPSKKSKEIVSYEKIYRLLLDNGMNYGRLHAQVYKKQFYDEADKAGFLLVAESSLSHRPKTKASLTHLQNMVKYLRNHPSIIIWSGSNEFEHWKVPRPEKTMKFLYKGQELIKELDPTRPVMHSGFGDALGKLDIYNIHYPENGFREFPRSFYWKNSTSRQTSRLYLDNYDKYNPVGVKPIAIGEQLIPTPRLQLESLFGDEYLQNKLNGSYKAQLKNEEFMAFLWTEAIRSYREENIAMVSPNLFYLPDSLDSVFLRGISQEGKGFGAYIKEYETEVKTGNNERTLVCFDDSGFGFSGTVDIQVSLGNKLVWNQTVSITLKPGELKKLRINFKLPDCSKTLQGSITTKMQNGGSFVYKTAKIIKQYKLSAPVKITNPVLVAGAGNNLQQYLSRICSRIKYSNKLDSSISNYKAVVITAAIPDTDLIAATKLLAEYTEQGGCVIILQRNNMPAILPLNVKLKTSKYPGATSGFIRSTNHYIFNSCFYKITNEDLKYWGNDLLISNQAMFKPSQIANYKVLIDSGTGLDDTLLLESRYGNGNYILSQLNLTEKLLTTSAAKAILYNILQYAGKEISEPETYAYYLNTVDPYSQFLLKNNGWELINDTTGIKHPACILIDNAAINKSSLNLLKDIFTKADTLYLHKPDAKTLSILTQMYPTLFEKISINKKTTKSSVYLSLPTALMDSLSSLDVNFFDKQQSYSTLNIGNNSTWKSVIAPNVFACNRTDGKNIIIDMLAWNQEVDYANRRTRYLSFLCTNLGIKAPKVTIKEQNLETVFETISIKDYSNTSIDKYFGKNSPVGTVKLKNIPFNFLRASTSQPNTMIRLNGRCGTEYQNKNILYDTPVDKFTKNTPESIAIECKKIHADTIYFAHSTTRNWKLPRKSKRIASYKINYNDSTSKTVDLNIGDNIFDSRTLFEESNSCFMGTSFTNTANGDGETSSIGVFKWINPFPEKKITSIEVINAKNPRSDIILFGITYTKAKEEYF